MSDIITEPKAGSAFSLQMRSYADFLHDHADQYAEYENGEILTNMTVTKTHSELTRFLSTLLDLFVQKHDLGRVYGEPFQMKLTIGDQIFGREPDIFFVHSSRFDRLTENFLDGPADLAIEVVSRESAQRDKVRKLAEYETAGVTEYWIIDPYEQSAHYFTLNSQGRFVERSPVEGVFESEAVAGLRIKSDWFWERPAPNVIHALNDLELL